MIDPNNIFFYLIFTCQIVLISWYLPNLIIKRMQEVLVKYPPKSYPKLYTKPIKYYQKRHIGYARANSILFTLGFSLLSAIIVWDFFTQDDISQMLPWAYFMLQMIPFMWLEITEYKYFKSMRDNNVNTTKKAEFIPRKLFDFVSPQLLGLALAAQVIAFSLVFLRYGWSDKLLVNVLIILGTNIFMSTVIYWSIYGKKLDPYQASGDRLKIISITVKTMFITSIAVSIFLSAQMLMKIYNLSYLAPLIMSIYCQAIVLGSVFMRLSNMKLKDIDFSVYKEQPKPLEKYYENKLQTH